MCEISRSRVPGLRHVRCREQRVEVRISSSPTKVICCCEPVTCLCHTRWQPISRRPVLQAACKTSTMCLISYQVAKILYQYYIYTAGPLHFFGHIPKTYNNNTILVSLGNFITGSIQCHRLAAFRCNPRHLWENSVMSLTYGHLIRGFASRPG